MLACFGLMWPGIFLGLESFSRMAGGYFGSCNNVGGRGMLPRYPLITPLLSPSALLLLVARNDLKRPTNFLQSLKINSIENRTFTLQFDFQSSSLFRCCDNEQIYNERIQVSYQTRFVRIADKPIRFTERISFLPDSRINPIRQNETYLSK